MTTTLKRGDAVLVRDSQGDMLYSGTVVRVSGRQVAIRYVGRRGIETTYCDARYVEPVGTAQRF